jgi:peptidoglycan/LPS O-acetylase OafA/YrhL
MFSKMIQKLRALLFSNPVLEGAKTAAGKDITHIPALDGLRTVAILGVFIYHIYPAALSGGYLGVDVFFVISGFLITSIIFNDIKNNAFSFKEFYLRRIQRLLPNAVAVVLVTLLLWYFFMPPGRGVEVGKHGFWSLLNVSNMYAWKFLDGGYWGDAAEGAAFTHFWSLGIEEQYYFFFPLFFFFLLRFFPRGAKSLLIAAAVASFCLCVYWTHRSISATFYFLPMRVWELLLGSALALFTGGIFKYVTVDKEKHSWFCEVTGGVGIILILSMFCSCDVFSIFEGVAGFPGITLLVPTCGSALVLYSIISGKSFLSRVFSTAPFVGIGKISYSLYLWHWPLIVLAKPYGAALFQREEIGALCGGLASLIFACAAYFFIEKPLRRRGAGRGRRLLIIAVGFALSIALCLCFWFFPREKGSAKYDRVISSVNQYEIFCDNETEKWLLSLDAEFVPQKRETGNLLYKTVVKKYEASSRPRVVLWGDSHATMYSKTIDDVCRARKWNVEFWGWGGCNSFKWIIDSPEARPKFGEFLEERKQSLARNAPDVLLVIERWDVTADERGKKHFDMVAETRKFVAETSKLAPNMKIVFVAQIPRWPVARRGMFDGIFFSELFEGAIRVSRNRHELLREQWNRCFEQISKENPNVKFMRPDKAFFAADGTVRYAVGRKLLYLDDDHVSDTGADLARPLLEETIDACLREVATETKNK